MSEQNNGENNGENKKGINPRDRQFLGHPIGLWVLFTTEMWERFCYYGMRAFLVLYLCSTITGVNPGFGWSEKGAYSLYGWFTGLVYFFPLFGGLIADRFIGQHRSVLYGGILIAAGEFALFLTEIFRAGAKEAITMTSEPWTFMIFFLGLLLITIGTGFFKPCISVMVGQLYSPNDQRRDVAFTYFYMGINVGAFLAPLVAGTIAEKYGWHWGFLVAAIGMIFGLMTYSLFRPKYLGHIGMVVRDHETGAIETVGDDFAEAKKKAGPLTRRDIDRIAVILVLSFVSIAFWSVYEQAGSSLTTFAKRQTNRQVPDLLAKSFPKVFLPNEDQDDAERTFEETKKNVFDAASALDRVEEECRLSREQFMADGKNRPEFVKAAMDYGAASQRVAESLILADDAIRKVNHSRELAGQEPLNLTLPSMPELLAAGQAERARITQLAEEAGCNPNEIVKRETETFEKERLAKIDPATAVYTFPSTWYQSVNPLWIVIFAPIFAGLWAILGKWHLEPSTPVKFGIGLIVLSFAFLFMIGGAIQAEDTAGNAGAYWLLTTYVFATLGELCLSPVGLSMVTRLAPPKYASFLMGMWFLSSAVAGYLSGMLAAVLGSGGASGSGLSFFFKKGLADYFLVMALIPLGAGLVMLVIAPMLRRMMHENN